MLCANWVYQCFNGLQFYSSLSFLVQCFASYLLSNIVTTVYNSQQVALHASLCLMCAGSQYQQGSAHENTAPSSYHLSKTLQGTFNALV